MKNIKFLFLLIVFLFNAHISSPVARADYKRHINNYKLNFNEPFGLIYENSRYATSHSNLDIPIVADVRFNISLYGKKPNFQEEGFNTDYAPNNNFSDQNIASEQKDVYASTAEEQSSNAVVSNDYGINENYYNDVLSLEYAMNAAGVDSYDESDDDKPKKSKSKSDDGGGGGKNKYNPLEGRTLHILFDNSGSYSNAKKLYRKEIYAVVPLESDVDKMIASGNINSMIESLINIYDGEAEFSDDKVVEAKDLYFNIDHGGNPLYYNTVRQVIKKYPNREFSFYEKELSVVISDLADDIRNAFRHGYIIVFNDKRDLNNIERKIIETAYGKALKTSVRAYEYERSVRELMSRDVDIDDAPYESLKADYYSDLEYVPDDVQEAIKKYPLMRYILAEEMLRSAIYEGLNYEFNIGKRDFIISTVQTLMPLAGFIEIFRDYSIKDLKLAEYDKDFAEIVKKRTNFKYSTLSKDKSVNSYVNILVNEVRNYTSTLGFGGKYDELRSEILNKIDRGEIKFTTSLFRSLFFTDEEFVTKVSEYHLYAGKPDRNKFRFAYGFIYHGPKAIVSIRLGTVYRNWFSTFFESMKDFFKIYFPCGFFHPFVISMSLNKKIAFLNYNHGSYGFSGERNEQNKINNYNPHISAYLLGQAILQTFFQIGVFFNTITLIPVGLKKEHLEFWEKSRIFEKYTEEKTLRETRMQEAALREIESKISRAKTQKLYRNYTLPQTITFPKTNDHFSREIKDYFPRDYFPRIDIYDYKLPDYYFKNNFNLRLPSVYDITLPHSYSTPQIKEFNSYNPRSTSFIDSLLKKSNAPYKQEFNYNLNNFSMPRTNKFD